MRQLTKAQAIKKIRGAQAKAMGEALELATRAELEATRGCLLQRIATPTAMRGGRRRFTARVMGDLIGCTADGQAVLVECKHRTEGGRILRPTPSDFEPHQVEALRQWHRRGGLALVAFFDGQRRVQLVSAVEIVGIV